MVVMRSKGEVQKDRGESTVIVLASKQVEQEIEEEGEQLLLPGIPDEITLSQIAPKLPWTAFYILSSVSRSWQGAIQSHQVYDARVRSKSTQTLVGFIDESSKDVSELALFSTEDGSCYHLPPILGVKNGIPWACECISLDGRLYVLGGFHDRSVRVTNANAEVYVLDLAGQRQWKQCASMKDARYQFNCGIKDEKIYVFGGGSLKSKRAWASEVYDPKEDTWSPIAPVPSFRWYPTVTTVGEELFVHSGQIEIPEWTPSSSYYHYVSRGIEDAVFAEVYHPQKDGWRTLKHFTRGWVDKVLLVGGKLHKLSQDGIEVYDIQANSWQDLQPISFGGSEPGHFSIVDIFAAVAIGDEILAIVEWRMIDEDDEEMEEDSWSICSEGTCLIKSQGVGGKNTKIVWQRLKCSIPIESFLPLLCPIQL